jgi:hypothetical protein
LQDGNGDVSRFDRKSFNFLNDHEVVVYCSDGHYIGFGTDEHHGADGANRVLVNDASRRFGCRQ